MEEKRSKNREEMLGGGKVGLVREGESSGRVCGDAHRRDQETDVMTEGGMRSGDNVQETIDEHDVRAQRLVGWTCKRPLMSMVCGHRGWWARDDMQGGDLSLSMIYRHGDW